MDGSTNFGQFFWKIGKISIEVLVEIVENRGDYDGVLGCCTPIFRQGGSSRTRAGSFVIMVMCNLGEVRLGTPYPYVPTSTYNTPHT